MHMTEVLKEFPKRKKRKKERKKERKLIRLPNIKNN